MPIKIIQPRSFLLICLLFSTASFADSTKIGYVNIERIVRDAPASILAGKKIEAEFGPRSKEIQQLAAELTKRQSLLSEQRSTLTVDQQKTEEGAIYELNLRLQRRQREFSEDLQIRQTEASSSLLEKANHVIERVASEEKFDIVIQDVAWASELINITDRVLKILADEN